MKEDSLAETLRLPKRFGHLPGGGPGVIVRRPWMQPAQAVGRVRGWCCHCNDEKSGDAWDEAVAPFMLRESEWMIWRRLPREAARRQWMRGRVAAKDTVRLLLLHRYHLAASLETIGILPDPRGQPRVACDALPDGGAGVLVSIAHCGNSSVALTTERSDLCHGVGIDVESRADDHTGLAEGGFASAETALLEDFPASERGDWLLHLWCAKEAIGKALGLGLMGNPLNYVVHRVDRERRTVEVEANIVRKPGGAEPARMTAHVGFDRGMAFAVARLEEP